MPAIELSQDDKDFLALANRASHDNCAKMVDAAIAAEREPGTRSWRTADFGRAAASWAASIQRAGVTMQEMATAYERVSNSWGGQDYFRRREREVDEGPFMTFAYDWIHGRIPVDPILMEVPWINHQFDVRSNLREIDFRDGSNITFNDAYPENALGVFLGGPMDGHRVSDSDRRMILGGIRDRAGGYQPHHFNFRQPRPINFARRPLDDELITMPTFETATYKAFIYYFPSFAGPSGSREDNPFIVLRQQP
jgi:hypothetical protein